MGQQLSVPALQDHIANDFKGFYYHPSFSDCHPKGNYTTCAASRASKENKTIYTNPTRDHVGGSPNVIADDLNKEYVVRIILKKNATDPETIIPRLFPSVTPARIPVTIHQYLAELSGIPILERPRPASPNVDDHKTIGAFPAVDNSSISTTFTLTKEFVTLFISKLHTANYPPRTIKVRASSPSPALMAHNLSSSAPALSSTSSTPQSPYLCLHPNVVPIMRIDESEKAFYLVCEKQPFSLDKLILFSPQVLEANCMLKPFLLYQFLQVLSHIHQQGVVHGNLGPQHLLLSKHNWLYLSGFECPSALSYTSLEAPPMTLAELQRQWVQGTVTNFGYLMALNRCARRRIGDPYFHPVFPWVTDFSGPNSCWRDLEKSKFRLTKGEEQMELMHAAGHHITDVLTELAYFSYLSRRAPIHALTHFVRSTYVPNEYPSSVERMFRWTPDESIPEFYTDPSIFKSINADMPDLAIPDWASSPEDFIQKHMAALESDHVSAHLHSWIDLTFGYQLTGEAARAAKNVIHVDPNQPRDHGLLQLFDKPHPARRFRSKPTPTGENNFAPVRFSSSKDLNEVKDSAGIDGRKRFSRIVTKKDSPYSEKHFSKVLTSQIQSLFETKANPPQKVEDTELVDLVVPSSPPATSFMPDGNTETQRSTPINNPAPSPFTSSSSFSSSSSLNSSFSIPHRDPMPDNASEYRLIESLIICENTNNLHVFSEPVYRPPKQTTTPHIQQQQQTDTFTLLQAQDIFAAGCIFAELYQKRPLFSHQTLQSYFSGPHTPPFVSLPLPFRSLVERMVSKNPLERPSARQALQDEAFPPYFSIMYSFLSTFYVLPTWTERLEHTRENLSMILELPEECFQLVVPHTLELLTCGDAEVQVRAVVEVIDAYAARMGPPPTSLLHSQGSGPLDIRLRLVRAVQALYELNSLEVQTHLVQIPIVDMVITRFGRPVFIEEILPHLLNSAKKRDYPLHDLLTATLTKITNILGISLSIKHIVYPLLACLAKPNSQHIADTLVAMAESMGESVVVTHYLPYLFSLLQKHLVKRTGIGKGESVPVTVLSMINDLVGCMCRATVLRSLVVESTALVLILLNPPSAPLLKALSQPLVRIAAAIGPHNTTKYMLRYLQQFFSNYGEFYVEGRDDILSIKAKPTISESEDFLRNIYGPEFTYSLYYQFWKIVGRDVMRREVSNSMLIEQILTAYVKETNIILDFSEVLIPPDDELSTSTTLSASDNNKKDEPSDTNSFSSKLTRTPALDEHHEGVHDDRSYNQFTLSWEVVAPLKDHNHSIRNVAVHPSESLILSSARDGVKCWSLNNTKPMMTYTEHTHNVGTVHFLNNTLAASCDGSIYVWDYERRTTIARFQEGDTNFITFIPFSDRLLLAATSEASISMLDIPSCQVVAEWVVPFQHHSGSWGTGNIRALALSSHTTCPDFDPPSPHSSLTLAGPSPSSSSSSSSSSNSSSSSSSSSQMVWDSPGGSWLAVGSTAGAISLLDARTGVLFDTWKAHDGQILKLLPMGKHFLLSCSSDKTIILWDLRPSPPQAHYTLKGHGDPVNAMCLIGTDLISAAGHKLAAEPLVRDDPAGSTIKMETYRLQQNKSNITALEVLPYHQLMVAGMEDGHVKLFH